MASLKKNVASQNLTFCMVTTAGAADASATVSIYVTKDNGSQASGGGTVTNSGNGQYNYAPTQAETNATDVGFMFTATGDVPVNLDFHTDIVDANGLPEVDVYYINAVSTAAVTAVKAIQGLTTADTIATYTGNTPQTGDSYAIVNNGTYGNSALEVLIAALNNLSATQVWAYATRILTAGTNIALTKGTGLLGLNDIAATAVVSNGAITTSGGKVSEVALVDTLTTYTSNTPQTGDSYAIVNNGSYGNAALETLLNTINTSTGTTIPGLIAALNNISQAQVKTQVVAALNTDTYGEPAQGTPSATTTLQYKISLLYKAYINQVTQTATEYALYNNGASQIDQKATTSDNGTTFEQTNIVSGP